MNFIATRNKGFRMKFQNGFAVSVQWGTENYCQRKSFDTIDPSDEKFWESETAEVAVFEDGDKMISIGDDEAVIGWCTSNEVAKIIDTVSTAKNKDQIIKQIQSIK